MIKCYRFSKPHYVPCQKQPKHFGWNFLLMLFMTVWFLIFWSYSRLAQVTEYKYYIICKTVQFTCRILYNLHCSWHLILILIYIFFILSIDICHITNPTPLHNAISFRFSRHCWTETTNRACFVYWFIDRVDSASRMTGRLYFSCKRFTLRYKEMYEKLARPG